MTLLALKHLAPFRGVFSVTVQLTETGFEESTGSLTDVLGLGVSVISGMEDWK